MTVPDHQESIRLRLAKGPATARQLIDLLGVSQSTVSRVVAAMNDQVARIGAARSIQYALRDSRRSLPEFPVHQVSESGRLQCLGQLVPVWPLGFILQAVEGGGQHWEGLPWWLLDMLPAGFLGRAFALRHGAALGLPARLAEWSDTQALRALLTHGTDCSGDLLLGDFARDRFVASPAPQPVGQTELVALACAAAAGDPPGSSAAGEQPKFAAYLDAPDGPRHVLVKFSEPGDQVAGRWRDLLLAEHLALETLRENGADAAASRVVDAPGQRFLVVERFDRAGALGRRALYSLRALDAEFVGAGSGNWPRVVRRLFAARRVEPAAVAQTELLWAFGSLIGNTDMHFGNLSFLAGEGRRYRLAPAYDMLPMAFAPRAGGGLPDSLPAAELIAEVAHPVWRHAARLAESYLRRCGQADFSCAFAPCLAALSRHLADAAGRIDRLG